ncbi:hypothetical protein D3C86_1778930 [compost metagenome]
MVHAFTASEGFALLALLFVGGLCGLRMCRAMLRSPTAFDLRREAAIAMTKPASFSSLNSHQQAAVFRALSECGPRRAASMQSGRLAGSLSHPRCTEHHMQAGRRVVPSSTAPDTASSQVVKASVHVCSRSVQQDAERSRWVTRSGALRV